MNSFYDEWAKIKAGHDKGEHLYALENLRVLTAERPLILWGAGGAGNIILHYCIKNNLSVECFVDAYKTGTYKGYRLISPEEMRKQYPNALVILCTLNEKRKDSMLIMLDYIGMSENRIELTPHMYNAYGEFLSYEHIVNHLDDFAWVFDLLNDSLSKRVFLEYIQMAVLNVPMNRTETDGSFFGANVLHLSNDEVLIDGGGYIGEAVEDFIKKTGGMYKQIYSFEPNRKFCEKVRQKLSKYKFALRQMQDIFGDTVLYAT